ncbi:MAG: hypothetical protein ACHQET_12380 [Chitinophagales bacterium]
MLSRYDFFKRLIPVLIIGFLLSCAKGNLANYPNIAGNWTLSYKSYANYFGDSLTPIMSYGLTPTYSNDTFSMNFSDTGTYVFTCPSTWPVSDSNLIISWKTEDGEYQVGDSTLTIHNGPSSSLFVFLHMGFSNLDNISTNFKDLGPDQLLIVSKWGKQGEIPYAFDSTILVRTKNP